MDLTPLMKPKSIAVIGASQRMSRGTRVVANLRHFGYGGRIFPINPKYPEVLGIPCYPDLSSTPEPADTVVVAIPAEQVQGVLEEAAASGVRGAIILSSGFAEAGPIGRKRQDALERLASERGLLICGPNCYGIFNIPLGAATFSAVLREPLRPGRVALISQSGGFSQVIADHLMQQRCVGLSSIVSCGNQAGLTVEDYMDFLVDDQEADVIGAFVEGFRQPEKLRAVADRARERRKPVVVLKVGRSESAREALLAHTGSLAGTPDIIDAVLKQGGIIQVSSLNEMIDTLTLMPAARVHRRSWRIAIVSGLGGECGHVSDVTDRLGLELTPLSPASVDALKTIMPDFAYPRNPLDGTGTMYDDPELFPKLIDVLLHDDAIDVVAVHMRADVPIPGAPPHSQRFSKVIRDALRGGTDRLVLCFNSFAGGDLDQEIIRTLAEVGVPFLEGTETAMLALRQARDHGRFLERSLTRLAEPTPSIGESVWTGRRGVLPTGDAMRLLEEFGIPLAETLPAPDADGAVLAAQRIGYPVVLKIDSPDIVHKSDVGGVRVGCTDALSVRHAFHQMLEEVRRRSPAARIDGVLVQRMVDAGTEMIAGVKGDPLFGPAVVCGLGGIFVEVLRDVSIRVPPIGRADAMEMISEVRGSALLRGARGRPAADVGALADVLVKVAALATAHRHRLKALDINPLVVLEEGQGVVAIDWLVEFS